MDIPLTDVRAGCARLIARIRRHASDANALLSAGRDQASLILMLTGFEELGKLLEYIQAAAKSERSGHKMVVVDDYRERPARDAHTAKATLTSDYFRRFLHLVATAAESAGVPGITIGTYSDHLSAIGADFMRARKHAMYVDFENGLWTQDAPVEKAALATDILGLLIGAGLIESVLAEQPTFDGVINKVTEMEKDLRQELQEFLRELVLMIEKAGSDE